ncbi:hypothetical protein FRC17_003643 [Serendipita sp. 399]|nr:hypothetical protein FRC17_003643 [Serendipita sp. 399]
MSYLVNKMRSNPGKQQKGKQQDRARKAIQYIQADYTSNPVDFPADFLVASPPDAKPILTYPINFRETLLPEYGTSFALVLDHVLSPSECRQLIEYAEMSAMPVEKAEEEKEVRSGTVGSSLQEGTKKDASDRGWQPALVNAGGKGEVLRKEYRDSDRIIWDCQEIVDRIWERCLTGGEEEFVRERLNVIMDERWPFLVRGSEDDDDRNGGPKWRMSRLNERMRFLRYGEGQYFHEHCDGNYTTPDGRERSFVTLHLYLNDSVQALTPRTEPSTTSVSFPPPIPEPDAEKPELEGGATPFFSRDMKRRLDVDPKAGRVLLFQHKDLYHSGDYVTSGVKYTMRTDLMYERVR